MWCWHLLSREHSHSCPDGDLPLERQAWCRLYPARGGIEYWFQRCASGFLCRCVDQAIGSGGHHFWLHRYDVLSGWFGHSCRDGDLPREDLQSAVRKLKFRAKKSRYIATLFRSLYYSFYVSTKYFCYSLFICYIPKKLRATSSFIPSTTLLSDCSVS